MEGVGEPVSIGGFSKMEYLLICSIVQSLMSGDWDWEQVRNVNVGDVSTIYHYILELAQTLQLDHYIYNYILELAQTLQLDLALLERKQHSI